MRKILCIFFTVSLCVISGCSLIIDDVSPNLVPIELQGPHYAKLNSIGCLQYNDMEMAKLADHRGDHETIDNLIKEKRCFVIPTGTDIFIFDYAKGDIVSAKLQDSTQLFYAVRSNLVAK